VPLRILTAGRMCRAPLHLPAATAARKPSMSKSAGGSGRSADVLHPAHELIVRRARCGE
jgi:hypothetical protein